MDSLKIGLIGFGTVGTGTVKCLLANRDLLEARAGIPLDLAGIADIDLESDRGIDTSGIPTTKDGFELIRNPDIQVIVELVGGTTVAQRFISEALANGKHVVTANKALLATHGKDLFRKADEKGLRLAYEASVAGGIPIIDVLNNGVSAARIEDVCGIINGTCNYILTKMSEGAGEYAEVLAEAQHLGYAEADPTADVGGFDAAHKICIVASLVFGQHIPFDKIYVEGINSVSAFDIGYARELGYVVKLLAIARDDGDALEVRVHPTLIPESQPLASVRGVYNAVQIQGVPLGPVMLYGQGAGESATGNAVVSDLVQIARMVVAGAQSPKQANFYLPGKPVKPMTEVVCPYYLRFRTVDKPGVIARIAGILGHHQISIASMIQHEAHQPDRVPVVLMVHDACEKNVMAALKEIRNLEVVLEDPFALRVHLHSEEE